MSSRLNLERTGIITLGLAAMGSLVAAGPCDIYASGNTPCVAAHSTTRALYSNYNKALYQVIRASDGTTADIKPLEAGGVADAGAQDDFCEDTTCQISIIYDQSGHGNHLTQSPPGGIADGPSHDGYDNLADAAAAPVTLNGQKVYGVSIMPGSGYRNNAARGLAKGDAAEGMYAVLDGTHYNDKCCFDYGNVETDSNDNGNGHMETIYFGSNADHGSGSGPGPWIMGDIENNLSAGSNPGKNPDIPTMSSRFVTAIVKGQPNDWAIRGGDASSGDVETFFSGPRPDGWNPMHKEGAVVLGTGGDNSNWGEGSFYEGAITTGFPSDDTEAAVQADIVGAQYSA